MALTTHNQPLSACSTLDDPVVMSNLMPWRFFASESQHQGNRWSLCAREICFKGKLLGYAAAPASCLFSPPEQCQHLSQLLAYPAPAHVLRTLYNATPSCTWTVVYTSGLSMHLRISLCILR